MDVLSQQEWFARMMKKELGTRASFRAMYSTWWDGIVVDPALMMIPIDDHQVHRGDAVFEAMKAVQGRIYLCQEHLERMERSAAAIGLIRPLSRTQVLEAIQRTLQISGLQDAILRLFLGRGPGTFTTNPYDTMGAQFHCVVTELKPLPEAKVENGVSMALSEIPPKDPWLAKIKSCNYLPNVLMKKEAVDWGVDFTIGVGPDGVLTEGSTENLILLDREGRLIRPRSQGILQGTTMMRIFELATPACGVREKLERDLTLLDLEQADEVMIVGTTLDVLGVTRWGERTFGGGRPGPVTNQLRRLLIADQKNDIRGG